MKDYDLVFTKKYRDFSDYGSDPYELHVVVHDIEADEDIARVKFSWELWNQMFPERKVAVDK